MTLCKFFRTTGGCKNGAKCRYSHDLPGQQRNTARSLHHFKSTPCPHIRKPGGCKLSTGCQFDHSASNKLLHSPLPHLAVRAFGGAIVFFDHGAEVYKVSVLEEWSAVRILGLQTGSTAQSIVDLIDELGIDLQAVDAVWTIEMYNQSTPTPSASIIVDRKTFSTRFITKLEAWKRTPGGCHCLITAESKNFTELMSTSHFARAFDHVQTASNRHLIAAPVASGECVVCLEDRAIDPIRTQCGLTYCCDCFKSVCHEELNSNGFIACYGHKCYTRFSIEELQLLLLKDAVEAILEESFRAYIRRYSQTFVECPREDCNQVYRKNKHLPIQTCRRPKAHCDTFFCTKISCNDKHPNISCDEWKSTGVYAAQLKSMQEYMKENNTKLCPTCREGIELREACNHIECPRCKTHFCFRCLQVSATAQQCYDHMEAVHGSWYNAAPNVPRNNPLQQPRMANPMEQGGYQQARLARIDMEQARLVRAQALEHARRAGALEQGLAAIRAEFDELVQDWE
jgi:hypothetical protein